MELTLASVVGLVGVLRVEEDIDQALYRERASARLHEWP